MKKQQKGGVLIIVALCLTVLMGFLGLVIDLGNLFVSKTEMQSAMDACSLAAAQELDGQPDAITRAQNAGLFAGNQNKVNLQSTSSGLVSADIVFSDALNGTYSTGMLPANAKYVKCLKDSPDIQTVFMQILGTDNTHHTAAMAVATRKVTSTKVCALPMMTAPKDGTFIPPYGYTSGDWIVDDTTYQPGHFEWGSDAKSASEVYDQLTGSGFCGAEVGNILITNGTKTVLEKAWNSRFGLYRSGGPTITEGPPDFSGYSYTSKNWPSTNGAYSDFLTKRTTFQSYGGITATLKSGNTITGLDMKNPYEPPLTHGTTGQHAASGANRRVVAVPIVKPNREIIDFACVLMLHPLDDNKKPIYLEFIGLLDEPSSPCGSSSIAGGTSVVNLVQ